MDKGKYLKDDETAISKDEKALQKLHYEVGNDINPEYINNGYLRGITSWEDGTMGGFMVKRMTEMAQRYIVDKDD
ncbi:hypothetical protein BD780_001917 [Clostridium tetanomorphum]|uniref:Small, acid-soluble spore protein, alpha/beta type n=1 Tax=Clostridium tetanomorphum TaxID=1553 RepID=A0A923J1J9_CLOTT|nr:small, acid-soluble spore protein, alpha/beta type [Clostridium tetanomorphum]KAJ51521.1 small acid-soluble spore protein alpha/beta type [Clostridium tetanomorphum DSM 665]MBC2398874.1 small, acid-soluble spore protein, alpha/beta type [Clostridium tetanomorphum]MBP1865169.1 hypothetical protein [Clostridium tetanomorphum]NRS84692.1 hypothetical protein [Clostridium tetanomorphum]NRZ97907.1 hypothetical protein [Clostridium tetanomorphum]